MANLRYIHLSDGARIPYALLTPATRVMKLLSAKWKLEILFALAEGHCRFGEILRATPGITPHMLSVRLNELEEENFITRHDFGQSPPRVEYRSTEATAALRPVFDALLGWARTHAPEIVPPRNRTLLDPGLPVGVIESAARSSI